MYPFVNKDHDPPSCPYPVLYSRVGHHLVPFTQFLTVLVVFISCLAIQVVFLNANHLVAVLSHEPMEFLFDLSPFIKGGHIHLQDFDFPLGPLGPWVEPGMSGFVRLWPHNLG